MFTNAKTSTGPHRRSPSHYSVALSPTAVAWTSAWTSAARHRCRRQRIMDVGGSASWTSAAAHHGQQQLGMDFRRPTRQRPSTLKRQQAHIDVLQTTTTSLCRRQRSHGRRKRRCSGTQCKAVHFLYKLQLRGKLHSKDKPPVN